MNSVSEYFKFVMRELSFNFHGLAYIHYVSKFIINKEPITGCPEMAVRSYCSQKAFQSKLCKDVHLGFALCTDAFHSLVDIYNYELSCGCYKCRATMKYLVYAVLRISDIFNLDILESCNLVLRSD